MLGLAFVGDGLTSIINTSFLTLPSLSRCKTNPNSLKRVRLPPLTKKASQRTLDLPLLRFDLADSTSSSRYWEGRHAFLHILERMRSILCKKHSIELSKDFFFVSIRYNFIQISLMWNN